MGFFDLPSPLFRLLDMPLAPLPPAFRLVVWALVASLLSMWLYKILSPQKKLVETEAAALAARRELNAYDGEFDGAWPLISRVFRTAGKRLWLALPPAVAASLPVLALLVWISNDYGYRFPQEGEAVTAEARPGAFDARMMERRVVVRAADGEIVSDVPLARPVPVVEKRHWWNALIGNPAGYLPEAGPVERIELSLPAVEVLPFGPSWLRGWEVLFFTLLVAFSLIIKKVGKIA
ncbi:hypothetical protein [Parvibaculum sp.]|uniref:hypothetical protein n=1 Tax=Parvibaculum sp. TaxID=2024848 RepID=UPI002730A0A4|nr:hypothetical protein [Parvibaculum sp.]MDP1625701.1 hypothetical protein [Parvibaculum sp.]MDP2149064.1 hypothetical protein [Parvibaculum sp.]MDP3328397.1 hypothetical protein [Parvibaculum sp.]